MVTVGANPWRGGERFRNNRILPYVHSEAAREDASVLIAHGLQSMWRTTVQHAWPGLVPKIEYCALCVEKEATIWPGYMSINRLRRPRRSVGDHDAKTDMHKKNPQMARATVIARTGIHRRVYTSVHVMHQVDTPPHETQAPIALAPQGTVSENKGSSGMTTICGWSDSPKCRRNKYSPEHFHVESLPNRMENFTAYSLL